MPVVRIILLTEGKDFLKSGPKSWLDTFARARGLGAFRVLTPAVVIGARFLKDDGDEVGLGFGKSGKLVIVPAKLGITRIAKGETMDIEVWIGRPTLD